MIYKHLFEGGPAYMSLIYIMWIVVIFLTIKSFINYFSDNRNNEMIEKHKSSILFIGSFAMLVGMFGQLIGLYGALNAIEAAGDIAPYLIAGGLKVSMLTVMYGMGLLLFSGLVWFILKKLLNK